MSGRTEIEVTRRVLVLGTFDLVHPGHLGLFHHARALAGAPEEGGQVIAGVNTDKFAAQFKRTPLLTLEERLAMVRACRYVDVAISNDGLEQDKLILRWLGRSSISPVSGEAQAFHLSGADWAPGAGKDYASQIGVPSLDWWEEHGIELMFVPRSHHDISTTELLIRARRKNSAESSDSQRQENML